MPGTSASGRRPRPTALKILEGNRGRRPLNLNEPQPRVVAPTRPRWLSPLAAREWKRVTAEMLLIPGWLTIVDLAVLAAYCQAFARWRQAEAVVDKEGLTYVQVTTQIDTQGMPVDRTRVVTRPEVTIARNERDAMKKFAVELGLSPASRPRLNVGPRADSGDDDDLD